MKYTKQKHFMLQITFTRWCNWSFGKRFCISRSDTKFLFNNAWVYPALHVIFCLTTTIHIHQNLTSSIKSTTSSYLSNVVLIFIFFALQLLTLVTLRRITTLLEYRMSIRNRKRLPNDYYDDSVDEVIKQDFTKDSMVYPPFK